MEKITYATCARDVEAYADCESIFSLIQEKVAKGANLDPDNIDLDFVDNKFCSTFSIGDECAAIDMDAVFSGLAELLCNDIAANATDFDFEYTEGCEEFDDWKIYIKGIESHNVQVETWAATREEPGYREVHGEELDFDEKKALIWAKEQVKKINTENIKKLFAKENFIPRKEWVEGRYDRKVKGFLKIEHVASDPLLEKEKAVIAAMNFSDEELETAFSQVGFGWIISDDYELEESSYDPSDDYELCDY